MNALSKNINKVLSRKALLLCTASVALFAASSSHAATTPVTFAQFVQATQSSNSNQFVYLDNGEASDAQFTTQSNGANGVSIPVIFTFQSINGTLAADLQGPQLATLTLTSSSKDAVQTANAFGATLGQQQIFGNGSMPDVLTITRNTPAAEGSNARTILLSMSFTGSLTGKLSHRTPTLSGNTDDGAVVVFGSDFVTISPTAGNDFNMAFTSWTTTSSGGGLAKSLIAGDSYFASATTAATATFDSTITPLVNAVPEPGIGLVALGLGLTGLTLRRRPARI